jgi:hypothetical protein
MALRKIALTFVAMFALAAQPVFAQTPPAAGAGGAGVGAGGAGVGAGTAGLGSGLAVGTLSTGALIGIGAGALAVAASLSTNTGSTGTVK